MTRVRSTCLSAHAQAIVVAYTIVSLALAAGSDRDWLSPGECELEVAAAMAVFLRAFRGQAIVSDRVVKVVVSALPVARAKLGLDILGTSVVDLANGDFLVQDWALFFFQ